MHSTEIFASTVRMEVSNEKVISVSSGLISRLSWLSPPASRENPLFPSLKVRKFIALHPRTLWIAFKILFSSTFVLAATDRRAKGASIVGFHSHWKTNSSCFSASEKIPWSFSPENKHLKIATNKWHGEEPFARVLKKMLWPLVSVSHWWNDLPDLASASRRESCRKNAKANQYHCKSVRRIHKETHSPVYLSLSLCLAWFTRQQTPPPRHFNHLIGTMIQHWLSLSPFCYGTFEMSQLYPLATRAAEAKLKVRNRNAGKYQSMEEERQAEQRRCDVRKVPL